MSSLLDHAEEIMNEVNRDLAHIPTNSPAQPVWMIELPDYKLRISEQMIRLAHARAAEKMAHELELLRILEATKEHGDPDDTK